MCMHVTLTLQCDIFLISMHENDHRHRCTLNLKILLSMSQWTTPQRTASSHKLHPSGKRPEKMAAAESKSTLDLLPEDLLAVSLLCLVKAHLF